MIDGTKGKGVVVVGGGGGGGRTDSPGEPRSHGSGRRVRLAISSPARGVFGSYLHTLTHSVRRHSSHST